MNDRVIEFVDAVRNFCDWASGHPRLPAGDARLALSHLVGLYSTALHLPDMDGDRDPADIPQSEWARVFARFQSLPVDAYAECFNPLVVPPEPPVIGSLADDLADIWQDLQKGLLLYDASAVGSAVWHWKFSFSTHWGRHAVNAIRALHALCFDG